MTQDNIPLLCEMCEWGRQVTPATHLWGMDLTPLCDEHYYQAEKNSEP